MIEPKTYVYISETKVDMFYEQLESSDVAKVGAEYGVDVKLFKWSGHRDRERVVTKLDKLKRVAEFLRGSKELGTLSNPMRYIAGTLDMNWGSLAREAVLFTGGTAKEMVLLIGSLKHVVGAASPPEGGIPRSTVAGAATVLDEALLDLLKDSKKSVHGRPRRKFEDNSVDHILSDALSVARFFRGARQQLEYIAKIHAFGEVSLPQNWIGKDGEEYKTLILGTPFYVAEA